MDAIPDHMYVQIRVSGNRRTHRRTRRRTRRRLPGGGAAFHPALNMHIAALTACYAQKDRENS